MFINQLLSLEHHWRLISEHASQRPNAPIGILEEMVLTQEIEIGLCLWRADDMGITRGVFHRGRQGEFARTIENREDQFPILFPKDETVIATPVLDLEMVTPLGVYLQVVGLEILTHKVIRQISWRIGDCPLHLDREVNIGLRLLRISPKRQHSEQEKKTRKISKPHHAPRSFPARRDAT